MEFNELYRYSLLNMTYFLSDNHQILINTNIVTDESVTLSIINLDKNSTHVEISLRDNNSVKLQSVVIKNPKNRKNPTRVTFNNLQIAQLTSLSQVVTTYV
ncbi:hypothetical protein [Heterosigma akashiwo virus 01]|uniref:Uncharacterized protein n=1 Tax=Heterosigma akashiwo virus 01 TaxID=97195 RepID=A0A1C9C584_HAV01|nr:hypothetical protein D1R72_gp114 [Heterosigma akashiwo virus 01]AOM63445.1 hypothetical protein [Heterosigma akashiwo virus 01]